MKRCAKCKQEKPSTDFYKASKTKDRLAAYCKLCKTEDDKNYYLLNRDAVLATVKNRADNLKPVLAEYHKKYRNLNREKLNEYSRVQREQYPEKDTYQRCRARARQMGYEFDLEVSDIVIPETCPILHIPLYTGEGKASANSPSLDRIDSSKGYIKGNIQVISFKANTMKSDANRTDLILFALWVLENYKEHADEESML